MNDKGNHFENLSDCVVAYKKVLSSSMDKANQLLKEINTVKKSFNVLSSAFDHKKTISFCPVCYVKEKNNVLIPCGHTLCNICAPKLSRCPICKKQIQKNIRFFMN